MRVICLVATKQLGTYFESLKVSGLAEPLNHKQHKNKHKHPEAPEPQIPVK